MPHLISQNYYYEDLNIQNVNERKYHIIQLIMSLCYEEFNIELSVLITYHWLLAGDLILVLLSLPFAPNLHIHFTTMSTARKMRNLTLHKITSNSIKIYTLSRLWHFKDEK